MDRRELLDRLRELKPWLEEQGVVDLRLFGSFARDEAGPDSDVDLLCRTTKPMGLEFFGLQMALGEKLGREVELITESGLHPLVRHRAERELVRV